MSNSKTFTIQINGIDKAYEDIGKLSDKLETLDKQISNSKMSTLISAAFGDASQIIKSFGDSAEKLAATVEGLKPLIETTQALQKVQEEAAKKNEKEEKEKAERLARAKIEASKKLSATTIDDLAKQSRKSIEIKTIELETKRKRELEEQAKKYGDEIKYTRNAKKIYTEYYDSLAKIYKDDEDKLQQTLKEKAAYEKAYADTQIKLSATIQKQIEAQNRVGAAKKEEGNKDANAKKAEEAKKEAPAAAADKKKDANKQAEANKGKTDKAQADKEKADKDAGAKKEEAAKKEQEANKQTVFSSEEVLKEIKHLSDLKKDVHAAELVELKQKIKGEEKLMTERKSRIEELSKIVVVKNTDGMFMGYNDLKETKKNLDKLKEIREENIESLKNEKREIEKHYDGLAQNFEKDTAGWIAIQEEKQKKMFEIDSQIISNRQEVNKSNATFGDKIIENINKAHEEFTKYYSMVGGLAKDFLALQLADLEEKSAAEAKAIEEKTKAHEAHKKKVEELEKESETATGGRAIVIQEQLAREMEARDELLKQKKEHETEKAEIDKQIERKKKQQAKIEKVQEIAKATAAQAAAIVKAWGMGPIIGPIMAAITVAATAVQIAKMKREWDKLEDGGLIRGKRHSQGGMRIEGTNIEVEGDEYVVNRTSTRKNLGLLEYINRQRRSLSHADLDTYFSRTGQGQGTHGTSMKKMYEEGGQLTNLELMGNDNVSTDDKILDAIARINFRPVVSVVDIADAQNNITEIKDIVGA